MKPININRKKIIIGAALLLVLLAAGGLTVWKIRPRTLQGNIAAYFHLYAEPTDEILAGLIDEFADAHPRLSIETHIMPYQDMKRELLNDISGDSTDHMVLTVLTGGDLQNPSIKPLVVDYTPWLQSDWRLFFNTERLKDSGWSQKKLEDAAAKGLDAFVRELKPSVHSGESLFLLGADFYWPWIAWLQHLEALNNRGRMPDGYSLDAWKKGLDAWAELSGEGVFNENYKTVNMASAHLGISGGKGLFVLSDSSIYSVYPPEERHLIAGIDFPGARSWQVGTSFFLTLLDPSLSAGTDEDNRAMYAAREFRKFLHSEEVRDKILTTTGIFLLPLSGESEFLAKREIPSITQNVRDPEMQTLLKYLDQQH